jgi:hypothetical protein
LADVYEREGLWTESAKILSDIPFDSGHKCVVRVSVHHDDVVPFM